MSTLRIALVWLLIPTSMAMADDLPYPLKVGATGQIQNTSEGRFVRVRTVIDDSSMIATIGFWATSQNNLGTDRKVNAWIRGIATEGATDGETFIINHKLRVTGTAKRNGRTMFVLEPVK